MWMGEILAFCIMTFMGHTEMMSCWGYNNYIAIVIFFVILKPYSYIMLLCMS